MAAVNYTRGVKLLLKVGNGADPEVFTARCSINAARGFSLTAETNDSTVPDCENPDLVAFVEREKVSMSASVTGAGMLAREDVAFFSVWWSSEAAKNCKIILDHPVSNQVATYTGAFHLTSFDITGDRGGKVECSITLMSDGLIAGSFPSA